MFFCTVKISCWRSTTLGRETELIIRLKTMSNRWGGNGAVLAQSTLSWTEYQCLEKGYRTYCKCRPLPVSCLQFSKTNVQSILNALLVNYESSMKCNQVKGIFQNEVIKLTSSFTAIEHALTYGQSPCPFTEVPSFWKLIVEKKLIIVCTKPELHNTKSFIYRNKVWSNICSALTCGKSFIKKLFIWSFQQCLI